MHKSTSGKEQLEHLEKVKTCISHPEANFAGSVLGKKAHFRCREIGVANGYKLSKRLKQHLDPSNVFFSPYYDLDFDL
ncbi:MAG: hypothetical protein Ct9H300mP28_21310 [Pseudomonadota bacterium]|nr:MAG: hypothetical protein Ct9H300mP28_21310 [Pseudomonadota bacterium]